MHGFSKVSLINILYPVLILHTFQQLTKIPACSRHQCFACIPVRLDNAFNILKHAAHEGILN
jgi:hypothetical protein